jgi:hypothetical protein
MGDIQKNTKNSHVVYLSGKPGIHHLLRSEASRQNSGELPGKDVVIFR